MVTILQMCNMVIGEFIWAGCCRVVTVIYGVTDLGYGEGVSVVVWWVLFVHSLQYRSCLWACGLH